MRVNTNHWWCSLLIFLVLLSEVHGGPHERKLLKDLLENYNTQERPVFDESEPVELLFGLTLQQIIDVDEINQVLTTNLWLNLAWKDENLKWNSSEYGNIESINLHPSKLWKPDVYMYNTADKEFDVTYPTNVVVTSDGQCLFIPPGIFKSTCKIDMTWFPFDNQQCNLKFGSWTNNGWKINLELNGEEGDTSAFVQNDKWVLLGVPAKRNEMFYDCCPEPYQDITFTIKIQRRSYYYLFNLMVPCILIASMAVLGFTLPPDSGEKLTLGLITLISIIIFGTIVDANHYSSSSIIGTYFHCIFFMVFSSVVTTIMILNFHHRLANTHKMPNWVRCIFLKWIPRVLCMRRPAGYNYINKVKKGTSEKGQASLSDLNSSALEHVEEAGSFPSGTLRELNLIIQELRGITNKIRVDEEMEAIDNDWKFMAMVLDRLCLVAFTAFTIIATIAVLLTAPIIVTK